MSLGIRALPLPLKLRRIDSMAWTDSGLALSDAEAGRTLIVDPEGRVIGEARGERPQALAVHGALALLAAPEALVLVDSQRGEELERWQLPAPPDAVRPPPLRAAAFSPDGRQYLVSTYQDAWLCAPGERPRWLPEYGPVAFVPGGLVIGASVLDPQGSPLRQIRLAGNRVQAEAVAVSPDGRLLAVLEASRGVYLFDTALLLAPRGLPGAIDDVTALALDPSGKCLAAGTKGGEILFWDTATASLRAAVEIADTNAEALAFTADGRRLLVGTYHGVDVWEVDTPRRVAIWRAPGLSHVKAISAREGHALVVGHEREVVFDDQGNALRSSPRGDEPTGTIPDVKLSAPIEGGQLWANDRDVGLHTTPRNEEQEWVSRFHDPIRALAAAPGLPAFYTGGHARWIAERDLRGGRLRRALPSGAGGKITALAFDPTRSLLAVGDYEGRVHLWRLVPSVERLSMLDGTSLQPEGTPFEPGKVGTVEALAFPGALLAACNELLRWEAPSGVDLGRAAPERVSVRADGLSADGRRALWVAGFGAEVKVLDTATGEVLANVPGPASSQRWTCLSADGERLLVAGCPAQGTEMALWSVAGPRRLATLHIDRTIRQTLFLPDGSVAMWLDPEEVPGSSDAGDTDPGGLLARWDTERRVIERWLPTATGAADGHEVRVGGGRALFWGWGPMRLIDLASGRLIALLPPNEAASITEAALSADGRRAVTADWAGHIRLWDASTGEWLASFCSTTDGGYWVRTPTTSRDVAGPYRELREIEEDPG